MNGLTARNAQDAVSFPDSVQPPLADTITISPDQIQQRTGDFECDFHFSCPRWMARISDHGSDAGTLLNEKTGVCSGPQSSGAAIFRQKSPSMLVDQST